MEWDGIVFLVLWLLTGGSTVGLAVFARKQLLAKLDAQEDLFYANRSSNDHSARAAMLERQLDAERQDTANLMKERNTARVQLEELRKQHNDATGRDRKTIETLTSQRDRAIKIIDDQTRVYNVALASHQRDANTQVSRLLSERDTLQQTANRLVNTLDTEKRGRVAAQDERDRLSEEIDTLRARLASIVNAAQGDTGEDASSNTL